MYKRYFGMLVVVLCVMGLTGYAAGQELLSNEGFETWTAGAGGPPDNWTLSDDTLLVAAQESGTIHGGTYSVAFTCSTTYTRWLSQLVTLPTEDSCYTFSCWAYDNDFYGRARVAIGWLDVDSVIIGAYQPNVYTTDQAAWQQITTGSTKAPAGAIFASCEIRIYDANWDEFWTHTTLYFDDASFMQTTCPASYDTLTCYEIQYNVTVPSTGGTDDCYPSPHNTETVVTAGIVTQCGIAAGFDDFWIQDGDAAWNGMFIFQNTQAPSRGDSVILTAEISEYYGMTEMSNLASYEVVSTGNDVPDPIDITPGDLAKSYRAGCDVDAEKYEGLLCKLSNVVCVVDRASSHTYADFYVSDGTDTCQIESYIYDYPIDPAVGDTFLSITGIVHYSRQEFELNPRDYDDIIPKTPYMPPGPNITGVSWTPTIPADGDPVTVMASIYDSVSTIANDSIFYQIDDTTGLWTAAAGTGNDENFYFFTLPGQDDPGTIVYFYVYAENDTGVTASPKRKYMVMDDPPLIKINEFMYDAPGTDAGCFIEIYGAPSLNLNNYELIMVNGFDGTDKKVIDLSGYAIPGDGFFVVGQDGTVPNVDLIDALADFENAPDNIHLRYNGFLYDAVGYGSFDESHYFMGETWPTYDPGSPYGYSLCRYPDGADADYNRQDFGVYGSAYNTPGTANSAPTAYTIQQIQQPITKTDSPHKTEHVVVNGIVTLDPTECIYGSGYYIEESEGGEWSGILVYDLYYEPTRGDSVEVTGTVTEEFGRTQISYVISYVNHGAGAEPDPYLTTTGNVYSDEALEGVLVHVAPAIVVDSLGYGEYMITDGAVADTCMLDDDCGYSTVLHEGDQFGAIRGVVDYSFGRFKIQPRDDDDFIALDLTITKSAADVHLEWTTVSDADAYVIYRSTDPTASGDSLDEVAAPTVTYLDTSTTGDSGTNYYYAVQARDSGSKLAESGLVGEYDRDMENN